jgi:hypothetical protein
MEGHLEITRFLVESGANVEAKTVEYSTPIYIRFQTACTLQLRSNFLMSFISGWTALMWSSIKGHLEITRFLVESGANVEAKTNEYSTPIFTYVFKPLARCNSVQIFSCLSSVVAPR